MSTVLRSLFSSCSVDCTSLKSADVDETFLTLRDRKSGRNDGPVRQNTEFADVDRRRNSAILDS